MSHAERLREAAKDTLGAFEEVQIALAGGHLSAKPGTKMLLAQQVHSIRALLQDMSTGGPSRKAWSYGQAAAPVLEIIVKSVENKSSNPDEELMARCHASIVTLRAALLGLAEGRDESH